MSRRANHPAHDWGVIGTRRAPAVDDLPLFTAPIARSDDPATSQAAAERVRAKPGTMAARLLAAYAEAEDGLTDEEAASVAGVEGGYWKRCSDLRNAGYIAPTGRTRAGASGLQRDVCAITTTGRALVRPTTTD